MCGVVEYVVCMCMHVVCRCGVCVYRESVCVFCGIHSSECLSVSVCAHLCYVSVFRDATLVFQRQNHHH